ncbi:oxidoreductase [Klebsiella pneumoniae]
MASRRAIGHWLILLLLSVLFSSLLLRIHLPAALLLGPLIAGLILSLRGVKLSIPRPCYLVAQAIVGCMIARAINPSVFGVLFNNWALVLAILLTTLAISGLTGWLLVRYSALPGATGAWGSSPGGASAMVVMAQEYGADVRLVALMQYLRVLFVVGAAALVVRYALGNEAQEMTQDIVWFPSLTLNFPFTLLLTAVACWLGMRLRIPSGAMLLPMLLGALAQGGGWLMLELPEWLLAMAYAVLGWTVGLQFNKAIFLLALKTLPQIIASIIGLILMCALMALALTHILQMDFMTAYLATSPGGLDTVAISAPFDLVFVAVKTTQTEAIAPWLTALCSPDTVVCVLQNGVEQRQQFAPLTGGATVLPSVVWFPAQRDADASVWLRATPRLTLPDLPGAERVQQALAGTRCAVDLAADFTTVAWRKLLQNAVAGLMVLTGRRAGMFAREDITALGLAYLRECLQVARAEGAALSDSVPEEIIAGFHRAPADLSTSILIDRLNGRPLEWDIRNGVVQRRGRQHGIPTPLSDIIVPLLAAASDGPG